MENELEQWEQRPWDPEDYDHSVATAASAIWMCSLVQALIAILLNGSVLCLGALHKNLRKSAANILYLSLCFGNLVVSIEVLYYRVLGLLPNFRWDEDKCKVFAFVNGSSVVISSTHMLLICSERFVHIVLLRKIPWHYAVSASISTFAISHMYLAMHFVMGELQ